MLIQFLIVAAMVAFSTMRSYGGGAQNYEWPQVLGLAVVGTDVGANVGGDVGASDTN